MKIKELFSDASCWTQNVAARNADGDWCDIRSSAAVCWCLAGAIVRCYSIPYGNCKRADEVTLKLSSFIGERQNLIGYNDTPSRTFEEIKRLVEQADV